MIRRCSTDKSQSYHNYGGRGIKVCDRWFTFNNFLMDMGKQPSDQHTIERRDNNGDYTPIIVIGNWDQISGPVCSLQ